MEAAVQRMLQKVYRCSVIDHGHGPVRWIRLTAEVRMCPQSSSNPVPKKTLTGARTFGKMGQRLDISRNFDL
ncbi:unnamed protein product [Ectocarpus sp. 12 AP-2014]